MSSNLTMIRNWS